MKFFKLNTLLSIFIVTNLNCDVIEHKTDAPGTELTHEHSRRYLSQVEPEKQIDLIARAREWYNDPMNRQKIEKARKFFGDWIYTQATKYTPVEQTEVHPADTASSRLGWGSHVYETKVPESTSPSMTQEKVARTVS